MENVLLLTLQIWKELSNKEDLGELSFDKVYSNEISCEKIKNIFSQLSAKSEVFSNIQLDDFSKDDIIKAMRKANEKLEIKIEESECFDADFMSFVEQYLGLENGGELYVPFAGDFSFARSKNIKYFSDGDVENDSIKTGAYKAIKNINIDFRSGNAVKNPLFREPEHMIKRFKNTLALLFSPSSMLSEINKDSSLLDAENFRKKSPFLLSFAHALASFENKAVLVIPSGFASRGNEEDFRKSLIDDNIIEAIISLPYGFWREKGAAIKTHILLLNKQKSNENIKYLRLEDQSLKALRGNISAHFKDSASNQQNTLKFISTDEIKKENYSFISDLYFVKSQIAAIKSNFCFLKEEKLSKIAKLTRSQSFKSASGDKKGIEYDEVLITDIPSSGYITQASRHVISDISEFRINSYRIEPFDILLNARGNVGVVGIVGKFAASKLCVAAQTMQIIRLTGEDKEKRAIALLMYFRSKLGKLSIASISDGTLMNQIISSKLKELEVPIFDDNQCQKLLENFQKEIELNAELERVKAKIDRLHCDFLNYKD